MIFISHNYNDKPIVEPIAIRLAQIYGQDQVFYDSWSIQPGEGIIDRMEEGLSQCKFFFFFVSKNSLASKMVKLEWQNALMNRSHNSIIKFIPVRLDQSALPFILTQALYIDLFSNGLEVALRQMVDVIEERNTFRYQSQFSNLVAYKTRQDGKVAIECRAKYYLEPISSFAFCTNNSIANVRSNVVGEHLMMSGEAHNIRIGNSFFPNGITLSIQKGTLPGFPFRTEFIPLSGEPFDIELVMHEYSRGRFTPIPMIILQ